MWSGRSALSKHPPIWKWGSPSLRHTEPDSLHIRNQRLISVLETRLVYALAQCGNQCNSYEHECRHQD